MSEPTNLPRQLPLISTDLADLDTPGVVVEMDAETADTFGAFEETALSEDDAWDANGDLEPEPESDRG